jgi:hypothetical protein
VCTDAYETVKVLEGKEMASSSQQKTSGQQKGSAAQRRGQERQRRQIQSSSKAAAQRSRNVRKQEKRQSPWLLIGGIVVLVAVVVGVFIYLSQQSASNGGGNGDKVVQELSSLSPSLFSQVGTGSGTTQSLLKPTQNNPAPLTGADGKPEFFYDGGEYCPYCAAQRWAMIVALSRFGKFSNVSTLTNSEGNYSTFTFVGSHYTSQYIDFVPVESVDNNHNALQTLTTAQNQLLNTYDAPPYVDASNAGSIPFIDIGNKFVSAGSYYDPSLLGTYSWQDVVTQVQNPNSDLAKGIIGTANYLTAAVCAVTNNAPSNVCTSDPIPTIEATLGQASYSTGTQVAAIAAPLDMITPRQE